MKTHHQSRLRLAAVALSIAACCATFAKAGDDDHANAFGWLNLVSDINGVARRTDPNLVNPWGIAIAPTGAVWIADNEVGVSTVYDSRGRPLPSVANPLVVTIPAAPGSTEGGKPTGMVFNSTAAFVVTHGGKSARAIFIFAGEDGTISGWSPVVDPTHAILVADRSADEAIYKGLAIGTTSAGSYLFATNFHAGTIDVFDKNFALVSIPGAFHDPSLAPGFAPFGIQNINGVLFVTYAKQDADKEDDVAGPGNGFIDMFTLQGHFIRRFASKGTLNSPWGLAIAPRKFGAFDNALLVGNFGDGRINAFNPHTGAFLGQLRDDEGTPLAFDGLWGLVFSDDRLFFTAGLAHEEHGLFGVIKRGKHFNDDD